MELQHDLSLIGMKKDKTTDILYFDKLPESFIQCTDFTNLFKLKKGKRTKTKENMEVVEGMEVIIYSPTSELYYYKILHEFSNMWNLLAYFKDKNLYVYTKEIQEEKLKQLYPETEINDALLY